MGKTRDKHWHPACPGGAPGRQRQGAGWTGPRSAVWIQRAPFRISWQEAHLFCSLLPANSPSHPSSTAQPGKTYLTILGNPSPESGGLGAFLSFSRLAGTSAARPAARDAVRRRGERAIKHGVVAGILGQSGYDRRVAKHYLKLFLIF